MSGSGSPDWADLLAAQWMDAIKAVYSEKGLTEKVHAPIVDTQGQAFVTGINGIYKDVDFDSPDLYMREVLKRNTWHFSVAKNYNDNIAINNALLDENGALRSWNDFKREAQKIAGDSIKYLKTEYNTVVAGAQMSRLWAEIQRDKAIFPLAQFVVVKDGRTSDICAPLDGVTLSVDDPMLAYFFPPNHFNCRTTVKKLRRGVITDKYELPDIPEAFRNNVGVTGEIFTKENRYIANMPEDVIKDFEKQQRKEKDKELLNWASSHIKRGSCTTFNSNNLKSEVRVSKSNIESLLKHIASVEHKDLVKNLDVIFKNATYSHSADLGEGVEKSSKNLGKKIARGVTKYNYYTSDWNGLKIQIAMEVMKNGYEQPYAIVFLK
ncbi:MAG TPA: minor capsid protein [Flavobacterium sp.]|nr:minor capsid protein [Flavobacterium sp.]